MTEKVIRILYVDDDALDRDLVRDALEKEHGGFTVTEAASRAEFEARLEDGEYDLILSDFNILSFEGLEVIDAVQAKAPQVPVVIVTGTGSEEVAVEAMKRGAADYVIKTRSHIGRLPYTIMAVLEARQLSEERQRANKDRERLLAEVQRRAAELNAINSELESFAYSVAHDLRAPQRRLRLLSQALLEHQTDGLDERSKGFLKLIHEESERAEQLIHGMLGLSQIARSGLRRGEVDLSGLAQLILEELKATQPERRVDCRIAPGLTANADPTLVRVVLENLLGNAWKYTSKHPVARIELGSTELDDETVYFVRDDGAGFDPAYSEKLFHVFQRLHGDDEFPGLGIGLATVRRIIHLHSGRVWAEGAVGEGSTFYFVLGRPEAVQ